MEEWNDIESAPKDGTKILVCNATTRDVAVAWWDVVSMTGHQGWLVSVIVTDWNYFDSFEGATHWRECPALPQLSG
jgi:hypothetical protein